MHAGRVDLLQDARHAPVGAVADGVDVELDTGDQLVDAQWPTDVRAQIGQNIGLGAQHRDPSPADDP